MNALMSAACILFLFWSITHLVKKLVCPDDEQMNLSKLITIMGSGLVGALAYTWSDTFWYSAVEGEVYAYSSLCTAVTFWLILKWEENYDQPHSTRWLVLIAYLIGVSVGVHLLNLLCIVAIVLVYYFKTSEKPTVWGSLVAVGISALIIAAILYGIVPGIVKVGGWFELLFVNGMGFSFNSGLIVYIILFIAALLWSVYETQKGTREWAINTSFLLTIALTGMPFIGHKASGVIMGILLLGIIAFYLFSNIIPEKFKPSQWLMNTLMLCIMTITIGYNQFLIFRP
jgi:MFS family permease